MEVVSKDSDSVTCVYAVDAVVSSGILDRSNRQQETRAYGAHEMRVLPST